MIVITANAQRILQWYKDTFVDFKTPQEYGRSAFLVMVLLGDRW